MSAISSNSSGSSGTKLDLDSSPGWSRDIDFGAEPQVTNTAVLGKKIKHKSKANVGKYTIHGASGFWLFLQEIMVSQSQKVVTPNWIAGTFLGGFPIAKLPFGVVGHVRCEVVRGRNGNATKWFSRMEMCNLNSFPSYVVCMIPSAPFYGTPEHLFLLLKDQLHFLAGVLVIWHKKSESNQVLQRAYSQLLSQGVQKQSMKVYATFSLE